MPKFRVIFHVDATGSIEVEAENEKEARQIAEDDFLPDCDNTELGDAIEIVEVHKLDG